jgi:hypothetical protein
MEQDISTENEARSSIEVTRGVNGTYGWKVKVYLRNDELLDGPTTIEQLDAMLRARFGGRS